MQVKKEWQRKKDSLCAAGGSGNALAQGGCSVHEQTSLVIYGNALEALEKKLDRVTTWLARI